MRIHLRFNHKLSIFLILIAAMGGEAFAQGRGRGAVGATNGFYRFNYGSKNAAHQLSCRSRSPPSIRLRCTTKPSSTPRASDSCPYAMPPPVSRKGIFSIVYYSKNGVTDKSKRPVWFLFNGGPGAATVWLHMGAFGPKMVKMEPNGLATPPPYTYVDNPNCLLDTGDLVFIDAMGTGFSRPEKPAYGAVILAEWRTIWRPSASSFAAS